MANPPFYTAPKKTHTSIGENEEEKKYMGINEKDRQEENDEALKT